MFQQKLTSTSVFVVRLFVDRPAVIFKFNLPEDVHKNRINSYYDRELKKIVIPKEVPKNSQKEFGTMNVVSSVSHIELSHQEIEE